MNSEPLVTVVITTKNEEKNIENCLKSIKEQTYPNIQIVVIDNFSSDNTVKIAKQYADLVESKGPERSSQRNYGMINLSKGEYVIYIDADMILSPVLIYECVHYVKYTSAAALHLSEIVLGKKYFSKVRRFERGFYDGTPIDGARFFNKKLFVEVGGFDEELFVKGSGEDWDIDKKIKQYGDILLLPKYSKNKNNTIWSFSEFIAERGVAYNGDYTGIYHNEAEFSLLPYLKKKSYYSQGFDGYIKKWGKNDPDIKDQFGLIYRYWTVFVENGKWKKLLSNLDMAIGMYFLRFLVGMVFVMNRVGMRKNNLV